MSHRPWMLLALAALVALPALAHDVWLQPTRFWIAPGENTAVSFQVGHGSNRERWGVDPSRVIRFDSLGPAGTVDRLAALRAVGLAQDSAMSFADAGAHLLVMESNHAFSELPAERFEAYLEEEGLTPAQDARRAARTTGRAGREIYSRRAKALIQVGPPGGAEQPHITGRAGLSLEIVPERSPYGLAAGASLPVRVWAGERPLAGGLVKLYDLAADARPVFTGRTDADGRISVPLPRQAGAWQMNVVWTRVLQGDPNADFETTFSSFAFGWPESPGPRPSR